MSGKYMNEGNFGIRASKKSMALINGFFVLFCLLCTIPLILIISISFSKEIDIVNHGFKLIPLNFTFEAYGLIFQSPGKILNAYKVTILITLISTVLNIFITSMLAYALSRPGFKFKRIISFYLFFTMLFGGGLVPYYILMTKYLHVTDTLIALIIPNLFSAFYAFLMRTNFQKLPEGLVESAKMDGAREFRIYAQIVMPLSTPTIATVGLMVALATWNDWFTSLLFINNRNLFSLQMLLQMTLNNLEAIKDIMSTHAAFLLQRTKVPAESLRMAMCLIAMGPILILFPFLQKYFVQGLTIGSVKG